MLLSREISILVLLGVLGALVQVQILFGVSDTYMGIRLNLGDFVIPLAGVVTIVGLILKKEIWPKWQSPCHDLWFFSLLALIFLGLINAYIHHGEIGTWALLNRGIGWCVLTGYIFFVGWCVTNYGERALVIYLKAFVLFALGTIIFGTIWFFFTQYGTRQGGNENYAALSGLLGNRNAFAFLMVTVVVIYTYFDDKKVEILSGRLQSHLTHIVWFFVPLAFMFNGSRAGWIIIAAVVLWFVCSKFKYAIKYILPAFILSVITIGAIYTHNAEYVFREKQSEKIATLSSGNFIHKTDNLRIVVAEDALKLWSEHKILGAGIGGFLKYQSEKRGEVLDQIDNSALWILTELGILGASVFGLFYIMALIALWKIYKTDSGLKGCFAQAMIVTIILFGLFSLVHQILYARYLWILLALALACPKSKTPQIS